MVANPPAKTELAYAELTASTAALGPANVDIPGLAVTFVALTTVAMIYLFLPRLDKDASAGYVNPQITDATTQYGQALFSVAASSFGSALVSARIPGLTPGTSYTFKGRVGTGAGAVTVFAAATGMKPYIQAVAL